MKKKRTKTDRNQVKTIKKAHKTIEIYVKDKLKKKIYVYDT